MSEILQTTLRAANELCGSMGLKVTQAGLTCMGESALLPRIPWNVVTGEVSACLA